MEDREGGRPPRIERLDNLTVNQIAAGEVIERPVSVVKELVENAIDAGGTRIRIEIRDGGLSLIRVTDDGSGIDSRDLALAVERHATSKLKQIGDLDDLSTLGFRGEALASIASVSALEIETRKKGEVAGYCLRAAGEEEEPALSKTGCPEGTRVTVERLFFNTPARLKFMKTAGYEGGLIHDSVIQLALGYPHIGFQLENQGRALLDTNKINDMGDLVELFYGKDARKALIAVESAVSKGTLSGWATAPPYSRGARKGFHIFINGRRIIAKDMQWAIERAYEYLLPKGRFPLCILHFRLPGDILDVNIHPGKMEVRINDPSLHASLTRALKTAVSGGQPMPDMGDWGDTPTSAPDRTITSNRESPYAPVTRHYSADGNAGDSISYNTGNSIGSRAKRSAAGPGLFEPVRDWGALYGLTGEGEKELEDMIGAYAALPEDSVLTQPKERNRDLPPGQWGVRAHNQSMQAMAGAGLPEDFVFGPHVAFRVIGQLHATFILAEVNAGLLLVDQHVAHERILYEDFQAKAKDKKPAQMLMQPVQFDLTAAEEEILIRNILTLNDLGLAFERFGSRQYLLRSEPADHSMDQGMIRELLDMMGNENEAPGVEQTRQALLVMNSCKAAVKANTPLTADEMTLLLRKLQFTGYPMTCPHGRPIIYVLPYRRLIQAFGRSS